VSTQNSNTSPGDKFPARSPHWLCNLKCPTLAPVKADEYAVMALGSSIADAVVSVVHCADAVPPAPDDGEVHVELPRLSTYHRGTIGDTYCGADGNSEQFRLNFGAVAVLH
jgi:hypothetical protein